MMHTNKMEQVSNPWTLKMEQFTRFTEAQRQMLDAIVEDRQQTYAPREDIIREGEKLEDCHVVLSGLAMRYKILPSGERQIMAFMVPGDLCDAEVFVLDEMDHSVAAMSATRCAIIPAKKMKELLREVSCLGEALWWGTMTDLAVLRERIVDHGRRDSRERVAHLLYEMLVRHRMIGQAQDHSFAFPVTQEELADATGMTPVHVNRMLQQLRQEGLIEFRSKVLKITDPDGLRTVAQFNANYLHLQQTATGDEAVFERTSDLV